MTKIKCVKLKKEAEALDYQPYPGDIGIRIMKEISAEAWQLWMNHQTMLINEMRLSPVDPKARKFLEEEMDKFLFGEGSKAPEGFVPEKNK
jgi:Fe-S cluster biosynthesis and repair protein YggX